MAGNGVDGVDLGASTCLFVSKLLEIVLEDVDNFIGLQLTLNSRRHSVNEAIEALAQLHIVLQGLGSLSDEVLSIIVGDSVDGSVEVRLRLDVDHFVRGLQANFQLLPLDKQELPARLLELFQIVSALTRLLVNELAVVVVAELPALHRYARADQGSTMEKVSEVK